MTQLSREMAQLSREMAQLSGVLSLATSSLNPSHVSSKDGKGDSGDGPAATSAVQEDETGSSTLSPLGKACSRLDFLSIHEILEKDDKGTTNKLLFQQWTNQNEEILECKKRGDNAFRSKDFLSAINYYSLFIDSGTMISPTVFARRCLCYLTQNMPQKALGDAIQGQVVAPDWPTAYYLQAAALLRLGMESDARESLRNGAGIERRRATSAQVDETEDMILEMPEVNKDAELYGVPRARLTRRRTS